jgi:hypothetical protein
VIVRYFPRRVVIVWLDLLSTFVLTLVTYVASVEDLDFVAKDIE